MADRPTDVVTERLVLSRPDLQDVDALFAILSDPRVWTHYPSLRHSDRSQTEASVRRWITGWQRDGLDTWVARERGGDDIIGFGGCSVLHDRVWNLGYRFAADVHGRGYATALARTAVEQARARRPGLPVVAYLLEHNRASAAVAQKVGLTLVDRGPDRGNPDATAVRLVYADRPLSSEELDATRQ